MQYYTYLIVGGGMAADAAARGIREVDTAGTVGLIGSEPHPPYNRPPLSKALWKGAPLDSIWRGTEAAKVQMHLGRKVVAVDLTGKKATDDRGEEYGFDKLLLATGGTPRRMPSTSDRVLYFRTLDDYQRLRGLIGPERRFAVVGGGFIGTEIAAALSLNGQAVTLVFPEQTLGARPFPADLSAFLTGYYREKGVELMAGETVVAVEDRGPGLVVKTQSGKQLAVDGVAAGLGIRPNDELARAAGLEVDDGVVVDEHLRTRHPDVYAAGDVARFPSPALGERLRVEHEDAANTTGRRAGRSMAGVPSPYRELPFFYSDLFDLGYEAVGVLDARLETVADWKEPFREGVVYYLRDGRVRGVLLWNTWGQVEAARRLIGEPGPFRPADLKGRLPA
jgi:NADPH-dependent 2,4-dienoyl-CoA reductase/sulfur reductase-like enzyme